jgi:hypothetical protein
VTDHWADARPMTPEALSGRLEDLRRAAEAGGDPKTLTDEEHDLWHDAVASLIRGNVRDPVAFARLARETDAIPFKRV